MENYGPRIVINGLVMYLDAANPKSYNGSGSTWYDISGNKNNGTLVNSPTYSSDNKGILDLNGSTQYVDLGNILPLSSSTGFSLSVWQRKNASSDGVSCAIFTSENTNTSSGILFYNHATGPNSAMGGIDLGSPAGYYGTEIVYSSELLTNNVWYHLCFVYDAGSIYIYVNGVLSGTQTGLASSVTFNKPCYIGKRPYAGYEAFYDGSISVFMIHNRALSDAEILQNYNALKNRFI